MTPDGPTEAQAETMLDHTPDGEAIAFSGANLQGGTSMPDQPQDAIPEQSPAEGEQVNHVTEALVAAAAIFDTLELNGDAATRLNDLRAHVAAMSPNVAAEVSADEAKAQEQVPQP